MATPSGARHRDTEQRILDLETGQRELVAASLRRRQLSVTEGDFVVSGGGDVVVEDGGGVTINDGGELNVYHANGNLFLSAGGYIDGYRTLTVWDEAGGRLFMMGNDAVGNPVANLGRGFGSNRPFTSVYGQQVEVASNDTVALSAPNGITISHSTTGSAANCRIETNGLILRVSSSLRYKSDVQDAGIDPAKVLQLEGRTWVAKDNEGDPEAPRYVGFIAEELDALGLTEFVEYDEQGRPDAIQYDRLSVGLLAVAKSQQEQLDALSARLEKLEQAG